MLKTTASNPFLKIAAPLSATFPSKPVNSGLDKAYTRPSPVHLHNSQLNTGYILPSYSLHERYPKGNGCTHLERHGSAPGIEMGFGWEQSSVDSFWSLPCEPQTFHACNPNFYGYLRQKRRQNFWVPTRCRWCLCHNFCYHCLWLLPIIWLCHVQAWSLHFNFHQPKSWTNLNW